MKPIFSFTALIAKVKFQFHYGSIKSFKKHDFYFTDDNFNSTMVRLKADYPKQENEHNAYFNSTMVRLKDLELRI